MKRQIDKNMVSPLTGGEVYLVEDIESHIFRKEEYKVHVFYYVCKDTGEHFTTEAQDEQFCNELYNQYRIKHGIPFPDEIKRIREHYGLSCSQITKIVGFGQNQWKQYENGNVPSESNGKSIVAIKSREGMLAMLESSRNQFDGSAFQKLKKKIQCASDMGNADALRFYFYGNSRRGIENGYSEMNPSKLQNMVQLIVSKEKYGVSKTKLNKEMFYVDFLSYKRYGRSISGLVYRAIQYGPVPEYYETVYDHVQGLTKKSFITTDYDYDLLFCEAPDISFLNEEDIDIIDGVMSVLVNMNRSDVIELSHKESGWINYKDHHDIIPYDEAYNLKAFTL